MWDKLKAQWAALYGKYLAKYAEPTVCAVAFVAGFFVGKLF